MVCPWNPGKSCGGCGTIWKNNVLITCPKCSGLGEDKRTATFYYSSIIEIPWEAVHRMCDPSIPLGT